MSRGVGSAGRADARRASPSPSSRSPSSSPSRGCSSCARARPHRAAWSTGSRGRTRGRRPSRASRAWRRSLQRGRLRRRRRQETGEHLRGRARPGSPSRPTSAARTRDDHSARHASAPQTRTIGAWPPAWSVATHSPLDYQGLAAIVRTAVEDGDEAVGIKPLKDGERAAWRAAMTMGGRQINVVVDQQTGIVTWYSDDEAPSRPRSPGMRRRRPTRPTQSPCRRVRRW